MKERKDFLVNIMLVAVLITQGTLGNAQSSIIESPPSDEIHPFKVNIPGKEVSALKQRILQTRWPDKETVTDQSQGIKLERLQSIMQYWGTKYDWKKAEAKLNALPQFMTKIDGVDIYFIHVRSKEKNALPIIITHGWPGSIFEFLKIIGP